MCTYTHTHTYTFIYLHIQMYVHMLAASEYFSIQYEENKGKQNDFQLRPVFGSDARSFPIQFVALYVFCLM